MKNLYFLLVMFFFSLQISAQELLKIEYLAWGNCCIKDHNSASSCKNTMGEVLTELQLSNGEFLFFHHTHGGHAMGWTKQKEPYMRKYLKTNFWQAKKNLSKDKYVVYHVGDCYWLEPIVYKGTLIIKEAKVREIKKEYKGSLNGDFSYDSFWLGLTGGGGGRGKISGSMSGGTKTVVNIIFENGTYASIDASDDPIWLETKKGMKVKHYKVRDTKLYKLCFID